MSAGRELGEVAMRYFGSMEMESREVTKLERGPSSRQTVPTKASRMALLGAAFLRLVLAGEKVVIIRVKRAVAVMTGLGGKLGREDGQQAKAAEKAELLVIGVGKAVVRVLLARRKRL
jgi:hypothetical protein